MPWYHVQIDTRLSPSVLIFRRGEGRAWERGYTVHCRSCLPFLIAYCMQKQRRKAWEKESRAWRQVDVRVYTRGAVTDRCNPQTLCWSTSSLPNNELYYHCLLNVTVSSSWTKYHKKDCKILRQAPPPSHLPSRLPGPHLSSFLHTVCDQKLEHLTAQVMGHCW